jgi:hypothetical protein
VNQASGTLREALAFAARTEHPVVISSLTDILVRLESLEHMDEVLDKFGKQRGFWIISGSWRALFPTLRKTGPNPQSHVSGKKFWMKGKRVIVMTLKCKRLAETLSD